MSKNNDLVLLASFIEQNYVLPYTHDELLELLERIATGHMLTKSEYDLLKDIIVGDGIEGEIIFSGDYNDLINKPEIPQNMSDLDDYSTIMQRINNLINALGEKDKELDEKISDNSRFLSALEVVLYKDIKRLEELVNTCKLFEGESLAVVIQRIQEELGWLDFLRDDIEEGKVLSERNFTAVYEEILASINETADGLAGYIHNVIAESILSPGQPNGNGVYRLDSIGEALATKVDAVFGYGLSKNDFSDRYKGILDCVLDCVKDEENGEPIGTLQDYVMIFLDRYKDEFMYIVDDFMDRTYERVEKDIQEIREDTNKKISDMLIDIEQNKQDTLDGVAFKQGDGPASISVGGLAKGTKLEGRSVRDVLLEIICPFVMPSVSTSLVLGAGSSYLSRIENIVEIEQIVANIERGSYPITRITFYEKVGSTYAVLAQKDPSMSNYWKYYFSENGYTGEVREITSSLPADHFMVEIEDVEGNTARSCAPAINVVCPIFYGTVSPNEEINNDILLGKPELLKYNGSNCSIKYTTKGQRMMFAIPSGYGQLVEILDQNGYVVTNSFERYSVQKVFKVKEISGDVVKDINKVVNYTVFCNNPSTVSAFEITYKFS
jgi:hypothetical protein